MEILDTTSEGVAGTVSPSRLSGVTLSGADVRCYTTNEAGQIDRLILNDATYPTTLSQVNSEDYSLIGWYDANGSAAGGKIRVLIAVKKD